MYIYIVIFVSGFYRLMTFKRLLLICGNLCETVDNSGFTIVDFG